LPNAEGRFSWHRERAEVASSRVISLISKSKLNPPPQDCYGTSQATRGIDYSLGRYPIRRSKDVPVWLGLYVVGNAKASG